MKKYLLFLNVILIISCTAQSQKNLSQHTIISDIPYCKGSKVDIKNYLDLYLPEDASKDTPLLVWIHGGAWAFGKRTDDVGLAKNLNEHGIAVSLISYRLSPATWVKPPKTEGIEHPEHIRDVAKAIAFLYKNEDNYPFSSNNIIVSGYSAGGHLSALLALDPRYLEEVGLSIRHLRASIPLAGAYDIPAYYESHKSYRGKNFADAHVRGVFGQSDQQLADASVTRYIKNSRIPMLVISESETYGYTIRLEKEVKLLNDRLIKFIHIHEETHQSFLEDLNSPQSKHMEKMVSFIQQNKI